MQTNDKYYFHLQAARALAIISVVGAHAWSFLIFWTGDLSTSGIEHVFWFTETLFHGSTLFFALISGLLFTKVLSDKGFSKFYKSKLLYVCLPYVIISMVFTLYFLQETNVETLADFLKLLGFNLMMGKAWIHFWYMPVLAVLFLLTPLLVKVQKRFPILFVFIMLLPLVISRSPFPDFVKPQSFVYFIGAYATGLWIGANYERFITKVDKSTLYLVLVAVITSVGLYLLYVNGYQHDGFYSVRQSLVYVQKLAIFALVLSWLYQREQAIPKWSLLLANYAFTIFFFHVFFIGMAIQFLAPTLAENRDGFYIALFGCFNLVFCVAASVLLGVLIKKVFKQRARVLIGA